MFDGEGEVAVVVFVVREGDVGDWGWGLFVSRGGWAGEGGLKGAIEG